MKVSGPLLGVALLVVFAYLIALAAFPAAHLLPHEFGYRHKLLREGIEQAFLLGERSRGLYLLSRADLRLAELEQEYALGNADTYPGIVDRYEHHLLSAANVTPIAHEVVRNSTIYEPRLDALARQAWDPPVRMLFDRARLNTVKAHRKAIRKIAGKDGETAASYSLSAAREKLDLARTSPRAELANRPLLDYTAWLLFTKGLSQELYNQSNQSMAFDNKSLEMLRWHKLVLQEMNESGIYTKKEQIGFTLNITEHLEKVLEEHHIERGILNETLEPTEPMTSPEGEGGTETEELADENLETVSARISAYKMDPESVVVNISKEVEFSLTAVQSDYTISIPSLGVGSTLIPRGETVVLRFNTTREGSFPVQCASYCLYTGRYGYVRVIEEIQ